MEYWKIISRHIRLIEMILTHLPDLVLLNDIHRVNDHSALFSKARFIQIGLNDIQHSITSILQYSGKTLSAATQPKVMKRQILQKKFRARAQRE